MAKLWVNFLFVASIWIVVVNARGISKRNAEVCPFGSTGDYPECICENGSKFNEIHNVCPPKSLESLSGSCPDDSTGVYPNCVCSHLGKRYDHKHSICLDVDRSKCPKRSVGSPPRCKCEEGYQLDDIHWYCRAWYLNDTRGGYHNGDFIQHCPPFHTWNGAKCDPILCPNDKNRLYPNCVDTHHDEYHHGSYCPPGQNVTVEKPYCHCPNNWDYTYPVCHERCPTNTYFELKSKTCVKRPCPKGWSGDYYPNCSIGSYQKCPDEFPGEWPNCNIYDQGPRLEDRVRKFNYV